METDKKQEINLKNRDSFTIYICMQGKLTLKDDNGNELRVNQGQTILIPAECQFITITPEENCKILDTYIGSDLG